MTLVDRFYFIGILFLALIFGGCAGPVQELQTAENTGTVRVTVGTAARTLIPALPSISSYHFSFESLESPPRETVDRDVYDYYLYLDLTVGSWNLTVTALDSGGSEIARGSALVVVASGTTNYVTVQLGNEPGDETGSLRYAIQFPDTVNKASLTLTSMGGGEDPAPVNLLTDYNYDGSVITKTGVLNAAAGNYLLNVDLYAPTLGNAGKTEVVHIYSNTETATSAAYTFAAGDFNPTVPRQTGNGISLSTVLNAIGEDTSGATDFTVSLGQYESLAPFTLTTASFTGKTIRIRGNGYTVALNETGSLFTVATGAALVLQDVTLQGRSDNTGAVIRISGGDLLMNSGTTVTGNAAPSSYGGGVYVYSGTFTMNGGTITGNSSYAGGGVFVDHGSTLTMSGGTISGNTVFSSYGGGVFVDSSSTLTMSGGIISGNSSYYDGGGVYIGGALTMSGGTITGNTATASYGGGVCVYNGALIISGGTITGNSALYGGGGVYVSNGAVTMSGGTISGNSSSSYGGGVSVDTSGALTMSGGTISANSSSYGGGVYVSSGGTFTKQSGGVIYGSDAGSVLSNTSTSGSDYGHAVYVDSGKIRNTTAGTGVAMDNSLGGSAGGWESLPVRDITYSTLDYTWTLGSDGRRQSPTMGDGSVTKARIGFSSVTADSSITIQLEVSSEPGYDYAFVSNLDNPDATYSNGYSTRISGTESTTVTIPVPTAGSHFIDIGYRKDGSLTGGSDCAWFKVVE